MGDEPVVVNDEAPEEVTEVTEPLESEAKPVEGEPVIIDSEGQKEVKKEDEAAGEGEGGLGLDEEGIPLDEEGIPLDEGKDEETKDEGVQVEEKKSEVEGAPGQEIEEKESEIESVEIRSKRVDENVEVQGYEPKLIRDKSLGEDVEPTVEEEEVTGLELREEAEDKKRPKGSEGQEYLEYKFEPRIKDAIRMSTKISGDFTPATGNVLVLKHPLDSYDDEDLEDYRQARKSILAAVAIPEDYAVRKQFLRNEAQSAFDTFKKEKLRNSILQVFISKYFRRRNMFYCLKEVAVQPFSNIKKYQEKLDEFGHFCKVSKKQREVLKHEIENLELMKEKKGVDMELKFKEFQAREAATGYGLVYVKSGTTISDRVVDNFIRRQRNSMAAVAEMRIKHIEAKSLVVDKEQEIRSLDVVNSKYTLIYYEKLKAENRTHQDKVEEKETELTKFRKSYQDTIGTICHFREKSASLSTDISDARDELANLEDTVISFRRQLNFVKQERDACRSLTQALKDETGLLLEPQLLRDMEVSKNEYNILKKELEDIKLDCNTKVRQLRNARKTLENLLEEKSGLKKLGQKKSNVKKLKFAAKKKKSKTSVESRSSGIQLEEFKPIVTALNSNSSTI